MASIPEIAKLKAISNNFTNLGFKDLLTEETLCNEKTENIINEVDTKPEILQTLNEYIDELNEDIKTTNENIEVLDVEIIRTKINLKKAEKSVEKLKSLNTTQVKIDASENDKLKIRNHLTNSSLLKKFTGLQLNKDGKGFLEDSDGQLKIIELNLNNPIEVNHEYLWNEIHQSSKYKDEWCKLFEKASKDVKSE